MPVHRDGDALVVGVGHRGEAFPRGEDSVRVARVVHVHVHRLAVCRALGLVGLVDDDREGLVGVFERGIARYEIVVGLDVVLGDANRGGSLEPRYHVVQVAPQVRLC